MKHYHKDIRIWYTKRRIKIIIKFKNIIRLLVVLLSCSSSILCPCWRTLGVIPAFDHKVSPLFENKKPRQRPADVWRHQEGCKHAFFPPAVEYSLSPPQCLYSGIRWDNTASSHACCSSTFACAAADKAVGKWRDAAEGGCCRSSHFKGTTNSSHRVLQMTLFTASCANIPSLSSKNPRMWRKRQPHVHHQGNDVVLLSVLWMC